MEKMQALMNKVVAVDESGLEHETYTYGTPSHVVFFKLKSHREWTLIATADSGHAASMAVRSMQADFRKGAEFRIRETQIVEA